MRWAARLVLVLAAGCYGPSAKVGVPCSSTGACPSGQHCDRTLDPPTCAAADARPIDAPPDAPPTCATAADCDATLPICDQATSFCRGCIADTECGTDVCTEYDGTCHNASNSLFVEPTGTGSTCSRGSPCSLTTAISQAANNQKIIVIGDGTYTTQFSIPNNYSPNSLTLSGTDLDPAGAVVLPTAGAALFVAATSKDLVVEGVTFRMSGTEGVDNRGVLLLSHVLVSGNGTIGVASSGAGLTILDSLILNNTTRGVAVTAGTLVIARTRIEGNASGGIDVNSASFTIESTLVAGNGTISSNFGGVRFTTVDGLTPQVFAFNTIADNVASIPEDGVLCPAALVIDSSIVTDAFAGCTSTFSITAPTDPGFVAAGTDYHLIATSPAIDMANPAATLTTDIDGQRRPLGAARDIGADEFAP